MRLLLSAGRGPRSSWSCCRSAGAASAFCRGSGARCPRFPSSSRAEGWSRLRPVCTGGVEGGGGLDGGGGFDEVTADTHSRGGQGAEGGENPGGTRNYSLLDY